jgi:type II secretory pathway pseudopilin PulG
MVPLMVLMAGFTQRRAHALSLMAMVIIASVASVPYVIAGQVRWDWAAALALGSISGAQIGARLLSRAAEGPLKVGFAVLLVVTAGLMVLGHPQGSGAIMGGTTLLLVMVVVGVLVGALSPGVRNRWRRGRACSSSCRRP